MLYIDGEESSVGVSETIISEDEVITSAELEWRYVGAAEASHRVAKHRLISNVPRARRRRSKRRCSHRNARRI